jgi:asparagine synthase (glutamine-hydrolysing)
MSGVLAVFNRDGTPVDRGRFDLLTTELVFRGSGGRSTRLAANVGLAHSRLDLSPGCLRGEQPHTIDGTAWIVADVRLDARADLIAALRRAGREECRADAPDADLILRAYHAWGEQCLERLAGDFVFAIWNGLTEQLFVARDQLGVKPLYYAESTAFVVVSNTLDCVRRHHAVSNELNDSAIADFLTYGFNHDPGTTSFRDVRRMPAAHAATWSSDHCRTRRYWSMPIDQPVHFKRAEDYTARFVEVMSDAVRDRLGAPRIGILMSGGLDSPTLAAVARRVLGANAGGELMAMTSVYDRLIPDAERQYASAVADHLRIPIRFDVRDDEISIAQWDQVTIHSPEPVESPPALAASRRFFEEAALDARVFFYGEGPDNALRYEWRPYMAHMLSRGQVARLMRAVAHDFLLQPRLPFWSWMARSRRRAVEEPLPPVWLRPELAERCGLRNRSSAGERVPSAQAGHPIKPAAYRSFEDVRWQTLFESCDLSGAWCGAEIRHPFLDLRVLRYMLSLPSMPWCRNKAIIRHTMRDELPATVLQRRKSPLGAVPDYERVKRSGLPRLDPTPALLNYVNPDKIPSVPASAPELRSLMRPFGLNYWLRGLGAH